MQPAALVKGPFDGSIVGVRGKPPALTDISVPYVFL
jgi:hypothetical protein